MRLLIFGFNLFYDALWFDTDIHAMLGVSSTSVIFSHPLQFIFTLNKPRVVEKQKVMGVLVICYKNKLFICLFFYNI